MKNRLRTLPTMATALVLAAGLSACSSSEQAVDSSTTGSENSATVSSGTIISERPESSENSATSSSTEASTQESSAQESSVAPPATESMIGEATDSEGIALGGPGEMAPDGAEPVDISATPYSDITAGEEITLRISGLNPGLGYHAAICAAEQPQGSAEPTCTGDSTDSAAQPWLKKEGGDGSISPTGTAEIMLIATTTGEDLDCAVDACVIKVFGDHSEGFRTVADLPVSFATA